MTSGQIFTDPVRSPGPAAPLVVSTDEYGPGHRGAWRSIDRGCFLYPAEGVLALRTADQSWIVPTTRASWIPAGEVHAVDAPEGAELHTVFCRTLAARMPDRCALIAVSPLLRELIRTMARMPADQLGERPGDGIDDFLLGQMVPKAPPPILVPEVKSPKLLVVARALQADPADRRTLEGWAGELGTTSRSLARAFSRQVRMTFSEYRRQVRLKAAVEKLARGEPVTAVALDLGFGSASSFIAMFRRATGITPGAYFASGG